MSGPYRGGRGDDPLAYGERPSDFGYGGRGGGGGGDRDRYGSGSAQGGANRWDTDRFASERGGRERFEPQGRGDFFEERDTRTTTRGGGYGRPRERSVDEIYERRGPGYGDDRYEQRHYHDDDAPRFERAPAPPQFGGYPWERQNNTTVIEKEREVYSPPPPRRGSNRPNFMRRQSSLDTFDRKPMTRFVETREEYGPPARYRPENRAPPMVPIPLPVPKSRQLGPPPGRYAERDYEEIRVAEPEYYGDEDYRPYPERVREREVIRRRRRSRSRDSVTSRRSHRSRRAESVRSDSVSSSSSSDRGTVRSVRSEFPKRGKTRMPARLVSKKAIIDLGYPFEEEGDTIIIMRALGRENIDEVIKLSESYNEITHISSSRSDAGTVYEEHKVQEVITIPAPPPPAPIVIAPPPPPPAPIVVAPPPAAPIVQEVITDTKVVEHFDHHHGAGPIIVNAGPAPHHHHTHHDHHDHVEIRETQVVDRSDALVIRSRSRSRNRDEQAIRSEIRALELEKELLRRERRRRGHSHSHSGRTSNTELVMYDKEHFHANGEEVTIVRKEAIIEPDGGVRIEKDRKAKPPPRVIRAMLKTLT